MRCQCVLTVYHAAPDSEMCCRPHGPLGSLMETPARPIQCTGQCFYWWAVLPSQPPILPHSQLRGKGFKRLFNAFSKWRASRITAEMTVKGRRESNSRACRDCPEESWAQSLGMDHKFWFVGSNLIIWCKMSNPLQKRTYLQSTFPREHRWFCQRISQHARRRSPWLSPAPIPRHCQEVQLGEPFVLRRKDYNRVFLCGSGIKQLFISMSHEGASVEPSSFEGLTKLYLGPEYFLSYF